MTIGHSGHHQQVEPQALPGLPRRIHAEPVRVMYEAHGDQHHAQDAEGGDPAQQADDQRDGAEELRDGIEGRDGRGDMHRVKYSHDADETGPPNQPSTF